MNFNLDGYYNMITYKKSEERQETERKQAEFIRRMKIKQEKAKLPFERAKVKKEDQKEGESD